MFSQEQVKEKIESIWFYQSTIRRKLLQKQKQWLLVKGILIPCIHIHPLGQTDYDICIYGK